MDTIDVLSFSTFGGNPLSAAGGLATIAVLDGRDDEALRIKASGLLRGMNNYLTNRKGMLEGLVDGGILELQSGACVAPFIGSNRKSVYNVNIYRNGTLQAGSPERPLVRDARLLLARDSPKPDHQCETQEGKHEDCPRVVVHSTQVRLRELLALLELRVQGLGVILEAAAATLLGRGRAHSAHGRRDPLRGRARGLDLWRRADHLPGAEGTGGGDRGDPGGKRPPQGRRRRRRDGTCGDRRRHGTRGGRPRPARHAGAWGRRPAPVR